MIDRINLVLTRRYVLQFFGLAFLIFLLSYSSAGQNSRKVRLSTRSIKVIEGADWSQDTSAGEDAFNNYVLLLYKDSTKLSMQEITKYYRAAGTRSILSIDSLCRPVNFDGNNDFDIIRYSYQWRWGKDGRLLAIDEYVKGNLNRRIVLRRENNKQGNK